MHDDDAHDHHDVPVMYYYRRSYTYLNHCGIIEFVPPLTIVAPVLLGIRVVSQSGKYLVDTIAALSTTSTGLSSTSACRRMWHRFIPFGVVRTLPGKMPDGEFGCFKSNVSQLQSYSAVPLQLRFRCHIGNRVNSFLSGREESFWQASREECTFCQSP